MRQQQESGSATDRCTACGCPPFSRRTFIQATGALGAISTLDGPAAAEMLDAAEHLIPEDKRLSPEWIRSLYERGVPEVIRGQDLKYVGMPVGGICCGQLYLGGDGRLWHWDIFDSKYSSDYGSASLGVNYAHPVSSEEDRGIQQGFALKIHGESSPQIRELSKAGFPDVRFCGQYPIGRVAYQSEDCPVRVELEAFSPFAPLCAEDSAIPATQMAFCVTNTSAENQAVTVAGWLENAVCRKVDRWPQGRLRNEVVRNDGLLSLVCSAAEATPAESSVREDIQFADFESDSYESWTTEGSAFGSSPLKKSEMASYQHLVNHQGTRSVNSHNSRLADNSQGADQLVGRLTSPAFAIQRKYIRFLICGGRHPGKTCINLVINGKTVDTATGDNSNQMRQAFFDVSRFEGQQAQLVIVDQATEGWGNIGIDHIVFSDRLPEVIPQDLKGFGSMASSLVDGEQPRAVPQLKNGFTVESLFESLDKPADSPATRRFDDQEKLVGAVSSTMSLVPGESRTVTFLVTWWFPYYPHVTGEFAAIRDIAKLHRHYRKRFSGAQEVATYVKQNLSRLTSLTHRWNETWYDSTLPYWLLDRTFVTLDCLATQTCHWFDNGRFYGWEGVTCCPGTCQHVWNYAQGLARVFPTLERSVREQVDYGIAFRDNGALDYRAESGQHVATDGQCGTILRAWREHTTAADDHYLRRVWPRVRKSIEFLIAQDGGQDGLLEGKQYNTLDQAWYGPMGWISSMYLAALSAGEAMARDVDDMAFASECRRIVESGRRNIVQQLYNGEYFIHRPDPEFPHATNTNDGCHIDQVFGQSLCRQLGLPRVIPRDPTKSALASIWKYNFAPDAGGYRQGMQSTIKGGRLYALKGEAGLVMSTWPLGGSEKAGGTGGFAVAKGYFNECMTGFEYQVAAHMIYEGEPGSELVEQGLAIVRAIHDRYHPGKRNPYNEIECGDHYSRAMASFGVFLALCGFEYHGPRGRMRFAPRVAPENFRAPFISAEGWGTFSQSRQSGQQTGRLELKFGTLKLVQLGLRVSDGHIVKSVAAQAVGEQLETRIEQVGQDVTIHLAVPVELVTSQTLEIVLR